MTIRTRLALWYSGILLVGLLFISGRVYYEMVVEHPGIGRVLEQQGHTPLEEFGEVLLFGGLPAMVLALVGGWFLMRRTLAPVTTLTRAVEQVRADTLGKLLPRTRNGDELDRLTEVFNEMTRRLDDSFTHVREFTLHASHELKTPLTILRGEFETALREEHLTEAQRERLFSQLDEVQRLAQIVDGLTLLTMADAGQIRLKCEPVALAELVRDSVEDAETLGRSRSLRVHLAACEPLTLLGDRHRLRQLLLTLTDNAVKYCNPGGEVTFTLHRAGRSAVLLVANSGPGLSPDLQPRVFERFFRGDPSHSHETEGSGLGLSIAHWIVQAHGGTIRFSSQPQVRTVVTVQLPLRADSSPAAPPG